MSLLVFSKTQNDAFGSFKETKYFSSFLKFVLFSNHICALDTTPHQYDMLIVRQLIGILLNGCFLSYILFMFTYQLHDLQIIFIQIDDSASALAKQFEHFVQFSCLASSERRTKRDYDGLSLVRIPHILYFFFCSLCRR